MIVFSGVRISMALIKTNPELHGLKIAERLRDLKLDIPKCEFYCDPLLALEP